MVPRLPSLAGLLCLLVAAPSFAQIDMQSITITTDFGRLPFAIRHGDFDGNGTIDLVTANDASNAITVLLNDGTGSFGVPRPTPVGNLPPAYLDQAFTVADFNADGNLDLAVISAVGVAFLSGDGTGSLSLEQTFLLDNVLAIVSGEFTADGLPDVIVSTPTEIRLFEGDVVEGFTPGQIIPFGAVPVRSFVVADLNGDGIDDVVAATEGSLTTFFGDPGADLVLGPVDLFANTDPLLAAGDFDQDGNLDVVHSYRAGGVGTDYLLVVRLGDGAGAFTPGNPLVVTESIGSLAAGDFDGDGNLDVVGADRGSCSAVVRMAFGDGAGDLGGLTLLPVAPGCFARSVTREDLDGDGDLDLAVALRNTDRVSVLRGDGTGAFDLETWPLAYPPSALLAGDLNGDGRTEIAFRTTTPVIPTLSPDPAGTLEGALAHQLGGAPVGADLADLDGDGVLDLAVIREGTLAVAAGNGSGDFGPLVEYAAGPTPFSIESGDLNADGWPDAIVGSTTGDLSLLLGDGSGALLPASLVATLGGAAQRILATDLDADGNEDLVVLRGPNDGVMVLLGDGLGGFGPPTEIPAGGLPQGLAAGDLDGDGDVDLAVASFTDGTLTRLLGDGAGGFTPDPSLDLDGGNARRVVADDYDGDGALDLAVLVSSATNTRVAFLIADGSGGYAPPQYIFVAGSSGFAMVGGELDGDGRPDLIVGNPLFGFLTTLRNETTPSGPVFRRGDVNGDGLVQGLADAVTLLVYQFVPGSPEPPCLDAADVDDSGAIVGLVDGVYLLLYQFAMGPLPPPPGVVDCGLDPTDDPVGCTVPPTCP